MERKLPSLPLTEPGRVAIPTINRRTCKGPDKLKA